ncbi:probable histone-lysine N-methyltransferase set-23 [Leguminivora glycinivorella]|uniref:probable histone-lysine N-methyltransferase set-23 n=1 Tax=Leguminivora glycinivorella TaxID=1035111 RepID=UPI00200EC9F9|nr:probable histone-lysine N-methyltransferase set-23 [Leguminivora glycinivorella]
MNDEYVHSDSNVIYVDQNIPGPFEDSVEYNNIVCNFNSQLINYCKCDVSCSIESCLCLMKSGDANYEIAGCTLNFGKDIGNSSYPIIECNSLCSCSENCGNRLVQKGPLDCLEVKTCSNISKGKGLFTTKVISKGTFICEYAGEILTLEQAKKRHKLNDTLKKMNYIFCLNEYCNGTQYQMIIDPSEVGNIGRYINHSCDPNCIIVPVRVDTPLPKLAIYSQLDIAPGSELTYNYGTNSFGSSEEAECRKKCLCGNNNCIGLMPSDKY